MNLNHITPARQVIKQYERGFPHGLDQERGARDFEVLIRRISELEQALVPFTRVHPPLYPRELTEVYFRDCVHAQKILDEQNSHAALERYRQD